MARRLALVTLVFGLLLDAVVEARVLGVFQGRIIQMPYTTAKQKWMAVQSRNGYIRKVNITAAAVQYDDDFPEGAKQDKPETSLCSEVEVRITAYQAPSKRGDGDWRATEVLILAPRREAKLVRIGMNSPPCA